MSKSIGKHSVLSVLSVHRSLFGGIVVSHQLSPSASTISVMH